MTRTVSSHSTKLTDLIGRNPPGVHGVVRSLRLTGAAFRHHLHQRVVELDASGLVAADAVERGHDGLRHDLQPGFLQHFPRRRLEQGFPDRLRAARQSPLPQARRPSAPDQQHPLALPDHDSDADPGTVGIFPPCPAHDLNRSSTGTR